MAEDVISEHAPARILVVDDDPEIRALVSESLRRHGYAVVTAANGREMDRETGRSKFDLIILDLMMPGEDGLSICRRVSARGTAPIVILSANAAETDRIVGLEIGADHYLTKPCSPRELLAVVRATLRRMQTHQDHLGDDAHMSLGFLGWKIDLVSRELTDPEGGLVQLSDGEFSLLRAFVERPRRVLNREQLLEAARGRESESFDRTIDVQVSRLRRKMQRPDEEIIRTVRNEGYMFVARVSRHALEHG